MTIYNIVNENNEIWVRSAEGLLNGPYKNEESAKRRIRDLKRKEAANVETITTVETPEVDPVETKIEAANDAVLKLAMSSEYGKSKPFAITPLIPTPINGLEIRGPRFTPQVGCYPAISKHAYRR